MAEQRATENRSVADRVLVGTRIIWRPVANPLLEILQVRDSVMRCGMFQDRYVLALSSGCGRTIKYRGRTVEQEDGAFFLSEPGDVHTSPAASGVESMDVMFIDPSVVRRVGTANGFGDVHWRAITVRDDELARDFRTTLSLLRDGDPATSRTAFDEFLACAIHRYGDGRMHSNRVRQDRALVRTARGLLHDRMREPIALSEIAEHLGITTSHLVRSFSAELGTPPHRYLVHLRVERARALLANGFSIVESAHSVGFADQSHLHRHFTRIIGMTPGEYARSVRTHLCAPANAANAK
jgi:AraC-like DNA-binding protein